MNEEIDYQAGQNGSDAEKVKVLRDALTEIMPYVLEDYFPDIATVGFKAAVEKAKAALEMEEK